MTEGAAAPLILTVLLAPADAADLDRLRRRHFPPDRNLVPAHVTLFHKLPGAGRAGLLADLHEVCASEAPFRLAADRLRFLCRGVAIEIEAAPLVRLRGRLAARWAAHLSAQDRQPYRPHVTIQNKAAVADARRLYERLGATWRSRLYRAEGLQLWRYEGGPWRPDATCPLFGIAQP